MAAPGGVTDVECQWSQQASERSRSAGIVRLGLAVDLWPDRARALLGVLLAGLGGDRDLLGSTGRPRAAGPETCGLRRTRRAYRSRTGPEHGITTEPAGGVAARGPDPGSPDRRGRADGRSLARRRPRRVRVVRGSDPPEDRACKSHRLPERAGVQRGHAIAIVDAGTATGRASGRTSRKPPRSTTRKSKPSAVALAAKSGWGFTVIPTMRRAGEARLHSRG